MARVTIEDCLKHVKNRFELVIIAAKRARQLMRGKDPRVEWDNDKSTVVALREIAAGHTDFDHHTPDDHEEEHADLMNTAAKTASAGIIGTSVAEIKTSIEDKDKNKDKDKDKPQTTQAAVNAHNPLNENEEES